MIQGGKDEQNNGIKERVTEDKKESMARPFLPFWLCDSSMFSSIVAGYSPFVSVMCEAV